MRNRTTIQFRNSNYSAGNKMSGLNKKHQGGFIITLELILIITILVIGTLVGIIAIRDSLVKHYVNKQSQKTWLVDDKGVVLGEAVDYDEHDAPRIFYIDRSQENNYRALLGVRNDRFTSREAIYYPSQNCTGQPCIKTISDEDTDSVGVDGIQASGNVSYFNSLQGFPNYAVGRGENGLPGYLFRESLQACPAEAEDIMSRWVSQKVISGEPCEPYNAEAGGTSQAFTGCLANAVEACECPANYVDQADVLANYVPAINEQLDSLVTQVNQIIIPKRVQVEDVVVGSLCCAEASRLSESDLVNSASYIIINDLIQDAELDLPNGIKKQLDTLIEPYKGEILCESFVQFKLAESVPSADDSSMNALAPFESPFWLNLPVDADEDNWQSTLPNGE